MQVLYFLVQAALFHFNKDMHLDELIKIKPYEKIVYIVRRHWLTYIPTVLLFAAMAVLPFAVYFILNNEVSLLLENENSRAIIVILLSIYELGVALFFYSSFLMYYLDMMIITNDRLVQIQQKTLFSRSVSELDLYRIQDTTSDITGVIATMIGYGLLKIQTAGERQNFTFEFVPKVNELRRHLIALAEEDRKYHSVSA